MNYSLPLVLNDSVELAQFPVTALGEGGLWSTVATAFIRLAQGVVGPGGGT